MVAAFRHFKSTQNRTFLSLFKARRTGLAHLAWVWPRSMTPISSCYSIWFRTSFRLSGPEQYCDVLKGYVFSFKSIWTLLASIWPILSWHTFSWFSITFMTIFFKRLLFKFVYPIWLILSLFQHEFLLLYIVATKGMSFSGIVSMTYLIGIETGIVWSQSRRYFFPEIWFCHSRSNPTMYYLIIWLLEMEMLAWPPSEVIRRVCTTQNICAVPQLTSLNARRIVIRILSPSLSQDHVRFRKSYFRELRKICWLSLWERC